MVRTIGKSSSPTTQNPEQSSGHILNFCVLLAERFIMTYTVTPSSKPIGLKDLLDGPPAPLDDDGKSVTAKLLVDCRCNLGECILYDDDKEQILFTDILGRKFHRLSLKDPEEAQELETFTLEKMLCAFALRETAEPGLLCAWEDGFQLYDFDQAKALGPYSQGEKVDNQGLPDRLNDGRVDPTGRFFVCGGHSPKGNDLKVYRCSMTNGLLHHEPVVDKINTTNSICWSLDGKTMYLANSPELKIFKHDYNDGTLSKKTKLHDKPEGFPDGSCVDSEGYIWNAVWMDGKRPGEIQRIDPHNGEIVFRVKLPDNTSETSCCCFGGKNLDILFITSAWENLNPSTEPHAGGIYAVKLNGIKGCPEARFLG